MLLSDFLFHFPPKKKKNHVVYNIKKRRGVGVGRYRVVLKGIGKASSNRYCSLLFNLIVT